MLTRHQPYDRIVQGTAAIAAFHGLRDAELEAELVDVRTAVLEAMVRCIGRELVRDPYDPVLHSEARAVTGELERRGLLQRRRR